MIGACALGLLSCGGGEPDAARLSRALGAPPAEGMAACREITAPSVRDECVAGVVRQSGGADPGWCDEITDERWRGECWFGVAERRAEEGDRWGGLDACGRSGPFYDECLYHGWTAELARVAEGAPDAISAFPAAREAVEFWSGIQTIEGVASAQLWTDFWFFAHNAHRPADLGACAALDDPALRETCEEGTRVFVLRALLGDLLSPGRPADLLDRICRSGEVPPVWTEGLFVPHPDLDLQVGRAAELCCRAAKGEPVRRWNPVFRPRTPGAPR